ncbi:MAG: flagellar brake protein, partial [Anaerolineales bacterium]
MSISNTDVITNPYHIISLLQRACSSHATVSLQRPHESFVYNSVILSLDHDARYFTIDAPVGDQLPLQVKIGDWLKFRIKLQGLVLSFEAIIKDALEQDSSAPVYQIRLPFQVNYQQRRGAFRASIGYQFNASFFARLESNQTIHGRMVDLSLRGVSIEIETALPRDLKHQTTLNECQLQSAGDNICITAAAIRTIQISEQSLDVYRLGIEFIDLTPAERRH